MRGKTSLGLLCVVMFVLLPLWVTSVAAAEKSGAKPTVFVSVVPQKYFLSRLCGELLHIEVMVKPGASPATYEPKPSQMALLSKSLAYFSIGVPFEKAWLTRIQGVNPEMQLIRTDAGIDKLAMAVHSDHEEADAPEHDAHDAHDGHGHDADEHGTGEHAETAHEHGGLDPHIWLSPRLVIRQATAMYEALLTLLPGQEELLADNYQRFVAQVEQLDRELGEILAPVQGMQFMVFHPSWGYFAHDYGLHQVPIEIEGKSPKPAQLKMLIDHAREEGITVVFVQPQFSRKSAAVVAREIGGRVVIADPLAEAWAENLQQVAGQVRAEAR